MRATRRRPVHEAAARLPRVDVFRTLAGVLRARVGARPYQQWMAEKLTQDAAPPAGVETVIVPGTRELGDGFQVRRALPSLQRRMVGPFIFFDQMGPTVFTAGSGLDVRPHPHIGLATVTYLLEGEILHRDTLGSVQPIRPGEVNWMTAGRGIAHSERTPPHLRVSGDRLHGIQTWVALPEDREEVAPAFKHHDAAELPVLDAEGVRMRLIAGTLFGARSPVETLSSLFYADAALEAGATLGLPAEHEDRAFYVLDGTVRAGEGVFTLGQLVVLRPGQTLAVHSEAGARLLLLGGEPLGPRRIWWNFVSSSQDRLEQAKDDWREGRFGTVPGETEFIPLPEEPRRPVVKYP